MTTEEQRERFASILRQSIQEGIVSVFGRETALSVEFYVDSSLAIRDMIAYTRALDRMFPVGGKLIEERCAQALYSNMGLEFQPKENYRLKDYVEEARKKMGLGDELPKTSGNR